MNDEEKTENLLGKKKNDTLIKIVFALTITLSLLISWGLGYRIGRIGYETKEVSTNIDEKIEIIKVMQEDVEVTKDTELDIFSNVKFDGKEIIAPRSMGTYQFCVSNEIDEDVIYSIRFLDEMKFPINMKYRLKIDNIYIRGNEDNYIGIDELDIENITVLKKSNNLFTLEWYWEDNDVKDTFVGSQDDNQYYTLKLKIDAGIMQ